MGKAGLYGSNVEIIALSEIYKAYVNLYFVPMGQFNQSLAVIANQSVAERNIELYPVLW
jgi:hypothetical protein